MAERGHLRDPAGQARVVNRDRGVAEVGEHAVPPVALDRGLCAEHKMPLVIQHLARG